MLYDIFNFVVTISGFVFLTQMILMAFHVAWKMRVGWFRSLALFLGCLILTLGFISSVAYVFQTGPYHVPLNALGMGIGVITCWLGFVVAQFWINSLLTHFRRRKRGGDDMPGSAGTPVSPYPPLPVLTGRYSEPISAEEQELMVAR